jgi:putative ABC transport system ATP-binding protein
MENKTGTGTAAASTPFVEIKHLYKQFDRKILFSDFNCTIATGEFVVLVGASGCGKTTLLNMIGGLEPVTSGSIFADNLDITSSKNLRHYFRDVVGFIFQNFALVEQKTVRRNLELVHPKGKTNITVPDALASVGMSGTEEQKVYALSGGEQQRVALSRLRLKNCSLILADEPTGSLDKENGGVVMDILHRLNEEGKTVIMVTHDESLIRPSDRIIRL